MVMEVRHSSAVMEMVKVGLEAAPLPRWVVRDVQWARSALPLGRGGVKRQWIIAHVKAAPLAEHDRAFHTIVPQMVSPPHGG